MVCTAKRCCRTRCVVIQKTFIEINQSVHCRLTFILPEFIWADRVFLVGDFNDWNRSSHPMRQQTRWPLVDYD